MPITVDLGVFGAAFRNKYAHIDSALNAVAEQVPYSSSTQSAIVLPILHSNGELGVMLGVVLGMFGVILTL